METPLCGIYKITSPSGKIYIGQSVNCRKRKNAYKNIQCHLQVKLYNSIQKYGWDAHKFEVIHPCRESELNELEVYYIELYQCFNSEHGLNLRSGGNRPVWAPESRLKISNLKKGNKHMQGKHLSQEARNKVSQAMKTRIISNETKANMSEGQKRRYLTGLHPRKGKRASSASRLSMSLSRKGKPSSRKGCTLSESTKQKLKEASLRQWANIRLERNSMIF